MKKLIFSFLSILLVLTSCSKTENDEIYTSKGASDNESYLLVAKSAMLTAEEFPAEDALCNITHYDFIAGQHILAGHIYVGNDEDSLYIQVSSTAGFQGAQENLKIAFTKQPFSGRPSAGHFPYKYNINTADTVVYLSFSLGELGLTCDAKPFYIALHGDVKVYTEEGTAGETAWGGKLVENDKPWWAYITYDPNCCERRTVNISRIVTSKSYFLNDKGEKHWVVTGNADYTNNCLGMDTYMYAYLGTNTPEAAIPLRDYWAQKDIGQILITTTEVENQIKLTYTFLKEYANYNFTNTYLFVGVPETLTGMIYTSGSGTWEGMDCMNFYGFPYQNADTISVKEFIIDL